MKRINLFVMSLLATTALTLSSCSNEDTLSPSTDNQETGKDFLMKFAIQNPTSNTQTRTVQENEYNAIAGEHEVNSGTIYITDANKGIIFQKTISTADWENMKIPSESSAGLTTLEVPVKGVSKETAYNVYFLANTTDAAPWNGTYTADTKFTGAYGKLYQFAMFNQNDKSVSADEYKVTFQEENKNRETPATIADGKVIKVERITARIDQPTSEATQITSYKKTMTANELANLTEKQKAAMDEAIEKVKSISLSRYAIANLAQSTYIMQHWDKDFTSFKTLAETWWQPYSDFGTATRKDNDAYFKTMATTTADKQANFEYAFENNANGTTNATSMYLEYTIKLKEDANATKDFTDGTFYRFNNKLYTSIEDILKAYKGSNPFGETNKAELLKELKIVDGKTTATEIELGKFRSDYSIEIFVGGKAYYKTTIDDQWYHEYGHHIIQRNSVYQLNVKNVFNIGADVPNGEPDTINPMYYLNVQVTVNPWVLNTQDVEFK